LERLRKSGEGSDSSEEKGVLRRQTCGQTCRSGEDKDGDRAGEGRVRERTKRDEKGREKKSAPDAEGREAVQDEHVDGDMQGTHVGERSSEGCVAREEQDVK
jgi:hypothetical protein